MTDAQEHLESKISEVHDDDAYLDHCVRTELHHLELSGEVEAREKAREDGWNIEVNRMNSFEHIRTYNTKM